jgi:dTDP-4-dehydrorhamnose reductase
MKVSIEGSSGYIGGKIKSYFESDGKHELVLPKREEPKEEVDLVINCVGRVGKPNLDEFKDSGLDGELATNFSYVNDLLQYHKHTPIIHLSTGCLFNGEKFFEEHEHPNFTYNEYYESKFRAERMLMNRKAWKSDLISIIRFRMPFDGEPSPRNLICKYLSYETLHRSRESITYIPQFCEALHMMVDAYESGNKIGGIYHFVNPFPITTDITQKACNLYFKLKKEFKDMRFEVSRSSCTLSTAQTRDKFESFGKSLPFTRCRELYVESFEKLKKSGYKVP